MEKLVRVCDNLLNEKIFNKCFVYPKHVAIEIDDKVLDFLIGMSNLSNEEILVKLFEKRGCEKVNVEYLMEEVLWTDPTRDTMYTYKVSKGEQEIEEVFEEGIRFPNFKVMKTESFRFKGSEPNIAELPVSKEKEL